MEYKDAGDHKHDKKKKLTREDFKKDVEEAVQRGVAKSKPKAKKKKASGSSYATWSVFRCSARQEGGEEEK